MKPNELIIGNFIEHDGLQFEVKGIGSNKVDIGLDELIDVDYVFGIPLTEEWLIKFGFEEVYRSAFRLKYDSQKSEIGYDFDLKNSGNGMHGLRYYGRYVECTEVHKLQNLFHALTSEELTLKE